MQDIYDFYNLIGKNIKRIRREHHESQEVFAENLDMNRSFNSKIESSVKTGISLNTLYAISQKYHIDIRDLFQGYEQFMKEKDEKN